MPESVPTQPKRRCCRSGRRPSRPQASIRRCCGSSSRRAASGRGGSASRRTRRARRCSSTRSNPFLAAVQIELDAAREDVGAVVELVADLPVGVTVGASVLALRATQELVADIVRRSEESTVRIGVDGTDLVVDIDAVDENGEPVLPEPAAAPAVGRRRSDGHRRADPRRRAGVRRLIRRPEAQHSESTRFVICVFPACDVSLPAEDTAEGRSYNSGVLLDIAVILLAAKVAAELCETESGCRRSWARSSSASSSGRRCSGWIPNHSEPVAALAELGVLLLLVQVGMEMDLAELGRVGRASMSVAMIGVAVPFLFGGVIGLGFGEDGNTALFVGAALTATSVGITARVFGDLKALATTEARIVLGAAVADDVLGLIILTVVVKIVTGGDVNALVDHGHDRGRRRLSRSRHDRGRRHRPGGVQAHRALHEVVCDDRRHRVRVMLVFAWAAEWAKLAPIIGAFVAGLAIGRSAHHVARRARLRTPPRTC